MDDDWNDDDDDDDDMDVMTTMIEGVFAVFRSNWIRDGLKWVQRIDAWLCLDHND